MSNVYIIAHGLTEDEFIILPSHIHVYTIVPDNESLLLDPLLFSKFFAIFAKNNNAFKLFKTNIREFCKKYDLINFLPKLQKLNVEKHSQLMNEMNLLFIDDKGRESVANELGIYTPTDLNITTADLLASFNNTTNPCSNTLSNILLYISSKNVQNKFLNIILFACRKQRGELITMQRLKKINKKCTTLIDWLITLRNGQSESTSIIHTSDHMELTDQSFNLRNSIMQGYVYACAYQNKDVILKYVRAIIKIYYHRPFNLGELCSIITVITIFERMYKHTSQKPVLMNILEAAVEEWPCTHKFSHVKNNCIITHDIQMVVINHVDDIVSMNNSHILKNIIAKAPGNKFIENHLCMYVGWNKVATVA